MYTLTNEEVEFVSGGRMWWDLGYWFGRMVGAGAGAGTQQTIDRMDNIMLGAMQYGA